MLIKTAAPYFLTDILLSNFIIMDAIKLKKLIPFLEPQLIDEILDVGVVQKIKKNTMILEEGSYVKMIPIVTKGLVKGFTTYNDKELLLYYIHPNESCVMSFAAGLNNDLSKINAITVEDSEVLLLPSTKVQEWIKKYPNFSRIFFNQYNKRYEDLISTINHLIFDKLDVRLYDYLKDKSTVLNQDFIEITHLQIAIELGTAREVISRLLKKLEKEGKIELTNHAIKVLG
jgi:CRP/FNR family transcriptional regulator